MKRQAGADDDQAACYVGTTFKLKDLDWLPTLDTFRTFLANKGLDWEGVEPGNLPVVKALSTDRSLSSSAPTQAGRASNFCKATPPRSTDLAALRRDPSPKGKG